MADISLTETSSAEGEEDASPSEVPEPAGPDHETESPTSTILIGLIWDKLQQSMEYCMIFGDCSEIHAGTPRRVSHL